MFKIIPNSLNTDDLISEHSPRAIFNFRKENLVYIIDLIYSIPANNKKLITEDGFVSINASFLQKKIRNYYQYLKYLLKAGVLICDNQYKKGVKCKGYKFAPEYSGETKLTELNGKIGIAKLSRQGSISFKVKKQYSYLLKWYNPNLQIDHTAARKYLQLEVDYKIKSKVRWDYDPLKKAYKHPLQQFYCSQVNINKIVSHEFNVNIDDKVGRLHSPLSNMKSELRNFLAYEGQSLVSIDVKSSQPCLSTLLFHSSFWDYNGVYDSVNIDPISVKTINMHKCFNSVTDCSSLDSFIMLCKSHQSDLQSDVYRFKNLMEDGSFYEYMENNISKELGIEYTNRTDIKAAMFQVLFTDNRFLGQKEAGPKRVFKQLFPIVYEMFRKVKQSDKTLLPIMLQRIESYLLLKVIAKRIAKEKQHLPIFTIHDSVITTIGNQQYVKEVVEQEMIKAIGFAPKLSIDYGDQKI